MIVQCSECGLVCNDSDVKLLAPEIDTDGIPQPRESKCTSCGAIDSFEPLNNDDE